MNIVKIFLLFLLIISFIILSWYTFIITEVQSTTLKYWALLMTAGIIWSISKNIKLSDLFVKYGVDYPNPILWEDKVITGKISYTSKVLIFAVPLIVAVVIFFILGFQPSYQIIGAPTFQLEFTQTMSYILIVISAIVEAFFFSGVTPALLSAGFFIFFYFISKQIIGVDNKKYAFILALVFTVILNPLIFSAYHLAVYEVSDIITLSRVFGFNLFTTLWVVIFRNILLDVFVHPANNLAIEVWGKVGIGAYAGVIMIVLLVIIIAIVGLMIYRKRK